MPFHLSPQDLENTHHSACNTPYTMGITKNEIAINADMETALNRAAPSLNSKFGTYAHTYRS